MGAAIPRIPPTKSLWTHNIINEDQVEIFLRAELLAQFGECDNCDTKSTTKKLKFRAYAELPLVHSAKIARMRIRGCSGYRTGRVMVGEVTYSSEDHPELTFQNVVDSFKDLSAADKFKLYRYGLQPCFPANELFSSDTKAIVIGKLYRERKVRAIKRRFYQTGDHEAWIFEFSTPSCGSLNLREVIRVISVEPNDSKQPFRLIKVQLMFSRMVKNSHPPWVEWSNHYLDRHLWPYMRVVQHHIAPETILPVPDPKDAHPALQTTPTPSTSGSM